MKMQRCPKIRFVGFGNEWCRSNLNSLTSYVDYRGKTPKKTDSGVFLVTAKNIKPGYIDYSAAREFVSVDEFDDIMRRGKPKKGDVLFTTEAPMGNVAQVDREDIALAQRVIKFSGSQEVSNDFLLYYLSSSVFQKELLKRSIGSTVKGIKGAELKKMEVAYPSVEEQQKIADFLSAMGEKIRLLKEKHALLQQYKKGVMQKLFSQEIRFKDDNGKAFPDWEDKSLADIAEPVKRRASEAFDCVMTISAGQGFLHQKDRFSQVIAGTSLDKYTHIKKGEFSYNRGNSKSYTYGCIYKLDTEEEALVPYVYRSFRLNEGNADFYAQLFGFKYLDKQLRRLISSSARMDGLLNIGEKDFYQVKVPSPSIKEQTKIADFLVTLDKKLDAVQQQIELTQTFKKGLLQQMFV